MAFRVRDGLDPVHVIRIIREERGQHIGITGTVGVGDTGFPVHGCDITQGIVLVVHTVACRPCGAGDIQVFIECVCDSELIGICLWIGRINRFAQYLTVIAEDRLFDTPFPVDHNDLIGIVMVVKGKHTFTIALGNDSVLEVIGVGGIHLPVWICDVRQIVAEAIGVGRGVAIGVCHGQEVIGVGVVGIG